MSELGLSFVWKIRLRLRAEGEKLWIKGDQLCAKGDQLWAKGNTLWVKGNKLWAEGEKLRAKGNRLWAGGNKLWAEGNTLWIKSEQLWVEGEKLRAEGNKLRAEGNRLWIKGDQLWAEAIIAVHGDIRLDWKSDAHCVLETGEEFTARAVRRIEAMGHLITWVALDGDEPNAVMCRIKDITVTIFSPDRQHWFVRYQWPSGGLLTTDLPSSTEAEAREEALCEV